MKLPPKQIDSFLQSIPCHIKAVLLYGPDKGVVSERLELIKKTFLGQGFNDLSFTKFDFAQIKDQPYLLVEEINNLSFGVIKKIILIYNCPSSLDREFKDNLKKIPQDVLIVLLAEDLSPASSLRKFFEEEEKLVSIPGYADEIVALKIMAATILKQENYTFDQDFLEFFCQSLQGDRTIFKNELKKIILYQGAKKHIALNEVKDIIPRSYEENIENFWLNIMLNKNNMLNNELENFIENISPIGVLRSFSNFILRVYKLKDLINNNQNFLAASKKMSPPIFFKNMDKFEAVVKQITVSKIISMLEHIIKLEKDIKTSSLGMESKLVYFFLKYV
jgi:DNA polymerase-3 subunit delta